MALSERKDVVLDVSNGIPTKVVKNHEWPKALPDAINQIVITYFDPSIEEVKELDKHFKQLKNETMAPFRNAIESKIVPLWNKPILAQLYKSKPTKSKRNFVENRAIKMLDSLIEQMSHLPADEQLEFLCTVYEGNWEKEEKSHFKQVKDNLKVVFNLFKGDERDIRQINETDVFKAYIAQVIFEKLNSFISDTITYPYLTQASTVRINQNRNHEIKIVETVEQSIHQENALGDLNRRKFCGFFSFYIVVGTAGAFFLAYGLNEDVSYARTFVYLGGVLLGFAFLLLIGTGVYHNLTNRHYNHARILNAATQHGLFRPVSEVKSDNNSLTESLLTPEQQAEYKEEDKESNSQPDSPRRGRGQ